MRLKNMAYAKKCLGQRYIQQSAVWDSMMSQAERCPGIVI